MYHIRRATTEDLGVILDIYARARVFMRQSGNPDQWGDHYPAEELLKSDIQSGNLYVVENGQIQGVFAFFTEEDPTYGYIEGEWLSSEPYGTIHRVASSGRGGIFGEILEFALLQNRHLRIDTHQDNHIMQHVVQKHGFTRCGIIYVEDGSPRIAYERI